MVFKIDISYLIHPAIRCSALSVKSATSHESKQTSRSWVAVLPANRLDSSASTARWMSSGHVPGDGPRSTLQSRQGRIRALLLFDI